MNTILIATVRTKDQIQDLINEIMNTVKSNHQLVISSSKQSVAINVNKGLEAANGKYILKVDDDITGFVPGWDEMMIAPLEKYPELGVISARLLNLDGSVQLTCSRDVNLSPGVAISNRPIVPFCCVAFRNDGRRMDENYIGSGFDDVDYCNQLRISQPFVKFGFQNEVRVIHKHEQKNVQLNTNRIYYREKWKNIIFPDGYGVLE